MLLVPSTIPPGVSASEKVSPPQGPTLFHPRIRTGPEFRTAVTRLPLSSTMATALVPYPTPIRGRCARSACNPTTADSGIVSWSDSRRLRLRSRPSLSGCRSRTSLTVRGCVLTGTVQVSVKLLVAIALIVHGVDVCRRCSRRVGDKLHQQIAVRHYLHGPALLHDRADVGCIERAPGNRQRAAILACRQLCTACPELWSIRVWLHASPQSAASKSIFRPNAIVSSSKVRMFLTWLSLSSIGRAKLAYSGRLKSR